MVKKTILVIGGSGLLGSTIVKDKPKNINLWFTTRGQNTDDNRHIAKFDLLEPDDLKKIIKKINPDFIIHCARLDPYDNEPVRAAQITKEIVEIINKTPIKILYVSTDAVYDGKKGNYKEGDIKNPITDYGKAKSAAEEIIQESCDNYIIVRTANIYGKKDGKWDNRTTSLLNELKLGKTVNRFNNVYRSFTLVDDLSKAIWKLINNNFNGVINISGPKKSFLQFNREMAVNLGYDPNQIKGVPFKEKDNSIAQDTSLDNSLAKTLSLIPVI
jgi:dTDP-4-dehydrorhamnose reductase